MEAGVVSISCWSSSLFLYDGERAWRKEKG